MLESKVTSTLSLGAEIVNRGNCFLTALDLENIKEQHSKNVNER